MAAETDRGETKSADMPRRGSGDESLWRDRPTRGPSALRTTLVAGLSCLLGVIVVVVGVLLWSVFGAPNGAGAGDRTPEGQGIVEAVEGDASELETAAPPASAD